MIFKRVGLKTSKLKPDRYVLGRRGKKLCVFLLPVLFFSLFHCGLEIGEKAPPIPVFNLLPSADYCSKISYKRAFADYFLAEGEPRAESRGEKLSKALGCVRRKITLNRDLLEQDSLDKRELTNLLNQDFIKTENMAGIIDEITHPDYFDSYIFIKDNMIHLISEHQADRFVQKNICLKSAGETALSKQDVNALLELLKNLSDFFIILEEDSYTLFESFFNSPSADFKAGLKSFLGESDYFQDNFVPFLSQFLNKSAKKTTALFKEDLSSAVLDQENKKVELEESLKEPLLRMAQMPPSAEKKLSAQNVKYILLNLYITQAFFAVYDANRDFILDTEELEPLSCLITALLSVMARDLEEKWWNVTGLYEAQAVTNYMIIHQEIPLDFWDLGGITGFVWHRFINDPEELEPLSWTDASRLIAVLFETLFEELEKE